MMCWGTPQTVRKKQLKRVGRKAAEVDTTQMNLDSGDLRSGPQACMAVLCQPAVLTYHIRHWDVRGVHECGCFLYMDFNISDTHFSLNEKFVQLNEKEKMDRS